MISTHLWRETNTHPVVGERDYKRFLRFPATRSLEGPLAENAAWARAWFAAHGHPWSVALRPCDSVCALAAPHFPAATNLALIAVSAGAEVDTEATARWVAGEPDRYYFLQCYASVVTEALLADARRRLGAEKHLCPGYPGWPITDNHSLLAALLAVGALPGPLTVLPSGMLSPKKSQLAICVPALAPAAALSQ